VNGGRRKEEPPAYHVHRHLERCCFSTTHADSRGRMDRRELIPFKNLVGIAALELLLWLWLLGFLR